MGPLSSLGGFDSNSEELRRPEQIELLISHREGRLAPQRVKVVGDLVLWESPLGKTVGGAHPDLFEQVNMTAHESKTHFARSMRTAAIKYEEIPAEVPFMTKTVHMQQKMSFFFLCLHLWSHTQRMCEFRSRLNTHWFRELMTPW